MIFNNYFAETFSKNRVMNDKPFIFTISEIIFVGINLGSGTCRNWLAKFWQAWFGEQVVFNSEGESLTPEVVECI